MAKTLRTNGRTATVRHDESTLFKVWVMWVIGFSEPKIGAVVGKSRKQVSGIVARSPYPNRSAMSLVERQTALDELITMRRAADGTLLDGGILDRIPHKVIDLSPKQVKQGR